MTQSRRSGWQAGWGHCHPVGKGQGREMEQEEPYAALQKKTPHPAPGQQSPRHQYRLQGREWPGGQAVHEPVMCPYGKGGQQPLELHLAKHHQQVQAYDPCPLLSPHTAEVLGPVLRKKGDMDMLDWVHLRARKMKDLGHYLTYEESLRELDCSAQRWKLKLDFILVGEFLLIWFLSTCGTP